MVSLIRGKRSLVLDGCLGYGDQRLSFRAVEERGDDGPSNMSEITFHFEETKIGQGLLTAWKFAKNNRHPNLIQVIKVSQEKLRLDQLDDLIRLEPQLEERRTMILAWKLKHVISIQVPLYGTSVGDWLQAEREHSKSNQVLIQYVQVKIVKGVLAGLQFLHKNGIVHGGLRPQSVQFSSGQGVRFPVKLGAFASGSETKVVGDGERMVEDRRMLGFLLWEVTGLVKFSEALYVRVKGGEEDLVKEHPFLPNVRQHILSLMMNPGGCDLASVQSDVPSRLTIVAEMADDLDELVNIAESGDTIDTSSLKLKEDWQPVNHELSEIELSPGMLYMSTAAQKDMLFKKMETRLFGHLPDQSPVKLLRCVNAVMEAEVFKGRDWVLFSHGTFLTFEATGDCDEVELLAKARSVMAEWGPVITGTALADIGAIRLAKSFPDHTVWLAFFCVGRDMVTIVILEEDIEDIEDRMVGLIGRQYRQEDADKPVIIGNSKQK